MNSTIEEAHERLLERTRAYVEEHGETFLDMFSEKGSTKSRQFFLSLPEEQREFLRSIATMEALLVG